MIGGRLKPIAAAAHRWETPLPETSYSTPLIALDAVALDTETTGLDARNARLIQIAALPLVAGRMRLEDRFERLVNPGIPIPKATASTVARYWWARRRLPLQWLR